MPLLNFFDNSSRLVEHHLPPLAVSALRYNQQIVHFESESASVVMAKVCGGGGGLSVHGFNSISNVSQTGKYCSNFD